MNGLWPWPTANVWAVARSDFRGAKIERLDFTKFATSLSLFFDCSGDQAREPAGGDGPAAMGRRRWADGDGLTGMGLGTAGGHGPMFWHRTQPSFRWRAGTENGLSKQA